MKKIKLDKIPYLFKNTHLAHEVYISDKILPEEGSFVVVEAQENEGKKDTLDYPNGRQGRLIKGDIIPAVIGTRKALVEFAGTVPKKLKVGDELHLLCESGLIGEITGVFESWGTPMKVKVLGAIVNEKNQALNLNQFSLPNLEFHNGTPIIALIGTRMDSGKTIMGCKVIRYFKQKGKKIAAIKPTGVAFSQDILKFKDYGAAFGLDFVDMGLPSTCGDSTEKIIKSTENLIHYAESKHPDIILIEFGDSLVGEYHVSDILKYKSIKNKISFIILAANDLLGVYGAQNILKQFDLTIDLITGPVANSQLGVSLISKYFKLKSESNQHDVLKTISLINDKLHIL